MPMHRLHLPGAAASVCNVTSVLDATRFLTPAWHWGMRVTVARPGIPHPRPRPTRQCDNAAIGAGRGRRAHATGRIHRWRRRDMSTAVLAPDRPILAAGETIDTPAMVVDEAILHQNIAEMASWAASLGVNLRPHMKTHKTPQIARLQRAAGAVGATVAKLGEAEVFVDQADIDDVL